jgi:hypothetical protein
MRHLRPAALAIMAVALCTAPVAVAHGPGKHGGPVVTPADKVAGISGSELFGEGWAQLLSNPTDTFSGTCIPLGRKGRIQAPEPDANFTASCSVKPGTRLFFFFGTECSNVEEPPFFGADEAEQRACALAFDQEFFVAASITVDDGEPVDVLNSRFEVFSPKRTVELPADNILGVPPQTATFTAHGWAAVVRKLRPGRHTIDVVVTDAEGVTTTFTATIDVVPGRHFHPPG